MLQEVLDLQVNGFAGVDFSSPALTLEQIGQVSLRLGERGVTGYLATVVTSPLEVYRRNLPLLARACREGGPGARLVGIHLEGPFLSPEDGARGAHDPCWIRPPDVALCEELAAAAGGYLRLVTLAPDQTGALHLIEHLAARGITVSLGHHLADAACLREAVAAGARACTHLGNGIPNLLPRHPNPIWDQLAEEQLMIMVIPDGQHLPRSFLWVVFRAAGLDRVIAVSDAAPPAGLPPGTYRLWGQEVVLEPDGKLWNPRGNHLAGSSSDLPSCLRRLVEWKLVAEQQLARLASDNPRKLLGRASAAESDGLR
ncbi:MAG: hypothetical protein Kow00109_27240 [Acidobacteriota bacterium]